MKKGIFSKLLASHIVIVTGFAVSVLLFSFVQIKQFFVSTLTSDLERLAYSLQSSVASFIAQPGPQSLDSYIKELGCRIDTRITVIDASGVVLADSEKDVSHMENHAHRPEIMQAMKGSVGVSIRYSDTMDEEMLYVAVPVNNEGRISGVIRTSLFLKDVKTLVSGLRASILAIASVIFAFSIIASVLIARGFSRPVKELAEASQRVSQGDFDAKVYVSNRDEFSGLARSFNEMTDKVKRLFGEVSAQKEELTTIMASIHEGLCLLDSKGVVTMSNESFRKMIKYDDAGGKYYWEIVRNPVFGDMMKKVMGQKENVMAEIDFFERVYLCSATYLLPTQKAIVLFFDLTEFKVLEKIKRDFVLNVSHELRTPLTAIKGFVETLEDEVSAQNRQYIEIIRKHTDRLIHIVQDLSVLSKLEDREARLDIEEVDLRKVLDNIVRIFEQRMKEKSLYLNVQAEEGFPPVRVDQYKIEQVFINIIDNAVKYTEKGGITISLRKNGRGIVLEFEDTGIGVPKEDLARIFERFYVVDKSRSRRLGGTGLGLSIVKHIVLLHNGRINVESTPGSGTRFTIILPYSS